jgi:hypothetical protein
MALRYYVCFYHDKRTFRSSHQAYKELNRIAKGKNTDFREGIEEFRVFFCDKTGGYHHTSITTSEMSRRQATKQPREHDKPRHEKFEVYLRSTNRNAKLSPKKRKTREE